LAGAVLNTYRQFAVPAFTPVLLNAVLIAFAGWFAAGSANPGVWLALGVFAAGFAQLLFQLPFLLRLGFVPRPRWAWHDSDVRKILTLMVPVIFGSSVAQINIMFDTLLASLLAAGSISWLYYSDRLVEFPLGVFGIALATVILPTLSAHHARESTNHFSATLDWALHLVVLIALPAALGLMFLAEPMLATIFYGGAFTANDVQMAGASLQAFAPGLIAFILVKVLSPGYYARQDTRTPVRIAVRALLLGMLLNVVFVGILLYTKWAPPHAGLAAATSASAFFNSSQLLLGLKREGVYRPRAGWGRFLLQVSVACGVMSMFVLILLDRLGDWTAMSTLFRIGALSVCVFASMAVYIGACFGVGLRPSQFRVHTSSSNV
jgi:putative peptidoglycan lipid II flippase